MIPNDEELKKYKEKHIPLLYKSIKNENYLQCLKFDTMDVLDEMNEDSLKYIDQVMNENDCYDHTETVNNVNLKNEIEFIRDCDVEKLYAITLNNSRVDSIQLIKSGSVGSIEITCEEILKFIESYFPHSQIVLIHNHPHYVNAGLSTSDREMPLMLKVIGHYSKKFELLDFMVVTKFDTWSFIQEIVQNQSNSIETYIDIFRKRLKYLLKKPSNI